MACGTITTRSSAYRRIEDARIVLDKLVEGGSRQPHSTDEFIKSLRSGDYLLRAVRAIANMRGAKIEDGLVPIGTPGSQQQNIAE